MVWTVWHVLLSQFWQCCCTFEDKKGAQWGDPCILKLAACIIVTHFERFKVQRQVKLSIAPCMWHVWLEFFCAKPTKKNQHLSCMIYTRCLAQSDDRMVLSSEARESQQLLMFASWSITILCTSSRVTFSWALSVKEKIHSVCDSWLAYSD